MPHPNTPLSYDVSKHVLRHMDPNKRVLLVIRCPELKAREKELPQTMESVSIGPARFTINNTTYQLGVVWQYPQGAVLPQKHLEINNGGGAHKDVDRYGFKVPTSEVTPGDFPLSVVAPLTEEETRTFCELIISWLKQKLDMKKKERKDTMIRRNLRLGEDPGRIPGLKELEEAIAQVELEMMPLQLRLDNNDRDLPFTLFLQLTISTNGPDGQSVQAIERLEYNQNLGPATKHLFEQLLRKPMNYVNELRVAALTDSDCFWLPTPLNLTARHLRINGEHCGLVMWTVGQFLHRNNQRPFETFAFEPCHEVNYDVDIANAAETLIIIEINPGFSIHTMRNRRVHFQACLKFIQLIPLIEYWERNGAPIGTYFTADLTSREGDVWYLLMRGRGGHTVAETPTRGSKCFPNCLIFPLAYNVQLEFYITSTENCPHPSLLNLEVQPRN